MKKSDKLLALLGRDTHFDGKLTFDGTVRLDGRFEGDICATGNLIVGREARIDADIRISCILISGRVRGTIKATHSIEILPQGQMIGTIEAPKVVIHEGAVLQGHCQTGAAKAGGENVVSLDAAPQDSEISLVIEDD
jgi:cytoskeletal protein CcmA (bactofilin family)